MPGIAGIISRRPHANSLADVDSMIGRMVHGPQYASGSLSVPELHVAVGWTALKQSFADGMPVWNENRDICLIFSGEEYTAHELKARLGANAQDGAKSETAYLLQWYEQHPDGFFRSLNGLFSGVIIDQRRRTVVLFNDRYGINRVYWHEDDENFYFASEAKALLKLLPRARKLDLRGVGEFMACGCVLQNRTLFAGVLLLPPASKWTFSPGRAPRREAYFESRQWESQSMMSPIDYDSALQETWARVLPKYLNGKLPAALSLTGGLDSRMILAWAGRSGRQLPCYTFNGMARECTDSRVAREVARVSGCTHQTLSLRKDFFEAFPELVAQSTYITDGTLDPTGATDLYLQRMAREIAPVRITGLYGGEILRRIVVFKPSDLSAELGGSDLAESIAAAAETYRLESQGHKLSFIAFKQAAWFIYPRLSLERSQLTLRTPYFDNELVQLAYRAPDGQAESKAAGLRLIAAGNPALGAIETDRGRSGFQKLHQEFTSKAEYACDVGMPQWFAPVDRLFRAVQYERLFLGRHKIYHFRVWYRDRLQETLKSLLLNERSAGRPYLKPGAMDKMVRRHLNGAANFTSEIHKLLALELAQKQLLD